LTSNIFGMVRRTIYKDVINRALLAFIRG
jgi:hypothetical protein